LLEIFVLPEWRFRGAGMSRPVLTSYLVVEELCDYVNDNWESSTPIHLAAYVMWRLNWIHPFADGNGRTSRILSYVVLSIRAGFVLPGSPTIPDQIADNRVPYFDALDAADDAYRKGGIIDVSKWKS
jgi:Fic family protein